MAGRVTKRKVDMLSRRILFDDDSGPGMARRDCKVIVVWTSSSPLCSVEDRREERGGAHERILHYGTVIYLEEP